jgi:hypothetical protein
MTALAIVADVEARMPRALSTAEQTRADTLLIDASSRIRKYCRQTFTRDQTREIISPTDNQIVLAQRPVISVDALERVNADGKSYTPFSVWTWDGAQTIMLGPPTVLLNAPEAWTDTDWFWRNITYRVQYTHGYDVIPEDIVGVCAGMVARVLMAPGAPGVISETIGGYQYRMADGFPSAQVSLTTDDMAILSDYRNRRNRTIELR